MKSLYNENIKIKYMEVKGIYKGRTSPRDTIYVKPAEVH